MKFFGIEFIGLNPENGRKLLITLALVVIVLTIGYTLRKISEAIFRGKERERTRFWTQQGIGLFITSFLVY